MTDAETLVENLPTAVAHRIREHLCVLVNALEAIRLTNGDKVTLAESLRLAERQLEALARLADFLHDPAPTGNGRPNG